MRRYSSLFAQLGIFLLGFSGSLYAALVPANSLSELVSWIKEQPAPVAFGSGGAASQAVQCCILGAQARVEGFGDLRHHGKTLIDHGRINLHCACARADLFPRIISRGDAAHPYDRHPAVRGAVQTCQNSG